jgi:hypothetical protein
VPLRDRADLFWGIGWHIRVEFPEDRRRGLDWVERLPVETRRDAMSGVEAAERWFGLAARGRPVGRETLLTSETDPPYL